MNLERLLYLVVLSGSFLLIGCATPSVADPNVDSIFFSPERAERERLQPKREVLAETERQTEAEKIRSITLRNQTKVVKSENSSLAKQVKEIDVKIRKKEGDLANLERQIKNLPPIESNSDLLLRRKNLENEISQLRSKQLTLLKIISKQ